MCGLHMIILLEQMVCLQVDIVNRLIIGGGKIKKPTCKFELCLSCELFYWWATLIVQRNELNMFMGLTRSTIVSA